MIRARFRQLRATVEMLEAALSEAEAERTRIRCLCGMRTAASPVYFQENDYTQLEHIEEVIRFLRDAVAKAELALAEVEEYESAWLRAEMEPEQEEQR